MTSSAHTPANIIDRLTNDSALHQALTAYARQKLFRSHVNLRAQQLLGGRQSEFDAEGEVSGQRQLQATKELTRAVLESRGDSPESDIVAAVRVLATRIPGDNRTKATGLAVVLIVESAAQNVAVRDTDFQKRAGIAPRELQSILWEWQDTQLKTTGRLPSELESALEDYGVATRTPISPEVIADVTAAVAETLPEPGPRPFAPER